MSRLTLSISAIALVGLVGAFFSGIGSSNFDERLPVGPGGSIRIDVEFGGGVSFDRGSLHVRSHDDDDVRVMADTSGWGKYAVDVDLSRADERVELVARVDGPLYWMFGGPTVDLSIWLPRDFSVEAQVKGEKLVIEDLTGTITASLHETDVTLRRTEGSVLLSSTAGSIDVEDVEGDLEVRSDDGKVDVTGVRGGVVVAAAHGAIAIASITGPVAVESPAGRLHGPVEIESVTGPVTVTSGSGSVEIDHVRGDVSVTTERGGIDAEDVDGSVEVRTGRGRIELHEIDGEVRAHSERGSIGVSFEGEPHGEIVTERGSIEIEVPEGAGYDLDAYTRRGRIEVEGFDEDDGRRDGGDPRWRRGLRETRVTAVNGGGKSLRLRNGRGPIEISE